MKKSLFGTDGVRGRVGTGIFVAQTLVRMGAAIGSWATLRYGVRPTILIVHDTRASAQWIKSALTTGLLNIPVDIIDAGVLPTPAAAHLMRAYKHAHAAIVISASHNLAEDNGIKILDAMTGKLSLSDELILTELLQEPVLPSGTIYGSLFTMFDAAQRYQDLIIQQLPGSWARGLRVVLDAAHGATSHIAARCFTAVGAEVITINEAPNGYNINADCGSTDVRGLCAAVCAYQADVGFAFDGDGDRVMVVNRNGIVKDGDDIICLLLQHPQYSKMPAVVGTIMTNAGLEAYCAQRSVALLRTAVGDKYVAEALEREELLLGGEPSGHIILRDHLKMGDGIMVARWVLATMVVTHNWELETFSKYPQITQNIAVTERYDLLQEQFASCVKMAQSLLGRGRVSVRYSGTEPVLRVMVEAEDAEQAQQISHNLVCALTHAFQKSA